MKRSRHRHLRSPPHWDPPGLHIGTDKAASSPPPHYSPSVSSASMRIASVHPTTPDGPSGGYGPFARLQTHQFEIRLPHEAAEVWDWHTRPGAVVRLTPGMTYMKVVSEASSLRDGTTVLTLPGGLRWVARHDPKGYIDGHCFTDVCVSAPLRQITRWSHRHLITGMGDGTTTVTERLSARVPVPMLTRIASYRRRQLTDDLDHLARTRALDTPPQTIAVTGASGLVGTRLVPLLRTAGHTVIPLVRKRKKGTGPNVSARLWDPAAPAPGLLSGVDAVVHLAGAPIFSRFTSGHTAEVRNSRVGPTRLLADLAAASGVKTFVSASAVGYYGTRRPEPVGEDADSGDGVLADIVSDWEADCDHARQQGVRVVNIRTGLVLAGGSPLLTMLATHSRAGGGRLGTGEQHFPWIAIDDVADIYHRAVVDPRLNGPVNAVAPDDITEAQFTDELAAVQRLRVPMQLPVPSFGPGILLGKSGAKELALADQHARPEVLERLGHHFRFSTARDLLFHELG